MLQHQNVNNRQMFVSKHNQICIQITSTSRSVETSSVINITQRVGCRRISSNILHTINSISNHAITVPTQKPIIVSLIGVDIRTGAARIGIANAWRVMISIHRKYITKTIRIVDTSIMAALKGGWGLCGQIAAW